MSRLDTPFRCPAIGAGLRCEHRAGGIGGHGTRARRQVDRRGRCRSQEQADRRRRGRRDGATEEGRHHAQGPLPVPRGEDAELHRDARPRDVALLRLRRGRRHLLVRHASRRGRLPRGAPAARAARGSGDRRADHAGGCPPEAPPRRARHGVRVLPRRPHEQRDGRPGACLPARPRLHRRDDRARPARLRAAGLGRPGPHAGAQAPDRPGGADRGWPRDAASKRARRLRSLPGPGPLPDPRRDRQRHRPRRPNPARGRARGRRAAAARGLRRRRTPTARSTSTRRPRPCSTRAGRSTRWTGRRRPSASRASP